MEDDHTQSTHIDFSINSLVSLIAVDANATVGVKVNDDGCSAAKAIDGFLLGAIVKAATVHEESSTMIDTMVNRRRCSLLCGLITINMVDEVEVGVVFSIRATSFPAKT